jgi:hypothetical protein
MARQMWKLDGRLKLGMQFMGKVSQRPPFLFCIAEGPSSDARQILEGNSQMRIVLHLEDLVFLVALSVRVAPHPRPRGGHHEQRHAQRFLRMARPRSFLLVQRTISSRSAKSRGDTGVRPGSSNSQVRGLENLPADALIHGIMRPTAVHHLRSIPESAFLQSRTSMLVVSRR